MALGFVEVALFQPKGLRIGGWAFDERSTKPPSSLVFRWAEIEHRFTPSVRRQDVEQAYNLDSSFIGFDIFIDRLPASCRPWGSFAVQAIWEDNQICDLPPISTQNNNDFAKFHFKTFSEFQAFFQNPATRVNNPAVQAHGAFLALSQAAPGSDYWLAAATVALYRFLEDGVFDQSQATQLLNTWDGLKCASLFLLEGESMRWTIAMCLACAYIHFASGALGAAATEFQNILRFEQQLESWPQVITTFAVATFMLGWITWREKKSAEAQRILNRGLAAVRRLNASSSFWSWYHYEESRVALNLEQQIFVLLRRIEGEQAGLSWPPEARTALELAGLGTERRDWIQSILPSNAEMSFGRVSMVLHRLARRGVIEEGPFPSKPS